MPQNREYRNKPPYVGTIDVQQSAKISMRKRSFFFSTNNPGTIGYLCAKQNMTKLQFEPYTVYKMNSK